MEMLLQNNTKKLGTELNSSVYAGSNAPTDYDKTVQFYFLSSPSFLISMMSDVKRFLVRIRVVGELFRAMNLPPLLLA